MLALGTVVSALVSFVAVKWLLRFVQSHTFIGFGIYRIVFGVLLLGFSFGSRSDRQTGVATIGAARLTFRTPMRRPLLCLAAWLYTACFLPAQETASVRLADGFGIPVGLDGSKKYYKARGFRAERTSRRGLERRGRR
jgi:hypothetical protein